MKKLLIICLIAIPGILKAQTSYQYRKGEVQQVVIKVNNTSTNDILSNRGNRVKIDGRWRYFPKDSIVINRVPCVSAPLTIVYGAYRGHKGYASCPIVYSINYKDSTSCVIFLNRSSSLEQ